MKGMLAHDGNKPIRVKGDERHRSYAIVLSEVLFGDGQGVTGDDRP